MSHLALLLSFFIHLEPIVVICIKLEKEAAGKKTFAQHELLSVKSQATHLPGQASDTPLSPSVE